MMEQMRVHPLARALHQGGRRADHRPAQRAVDGEGGPDRRARLPDGRAAARPGQRGPEEGVLGDLVLCPRSPLVRVRPRGTARTPRSSCSPCTGSCTCSATTTPRPKHREMFGLQDELLAAWRARGADPPMTSGDAWLLITAAALVVLAGLFSAADAPSRRSPGRVPRSCSPRSPRRAPLWRCSTTCPRYLNTALLLPALRDLRHRPGHAPGQRPTAAPGGPPC